MSKGYLVEDTLLSCLAICHCSLPSYFVKQIGEVHQCVVFLFFVRRWMRRDFVYFR